jgi:hypothetical protein
VVQNTTLVEAAQATQIVQTGDGEVTLPATAGSEFSGNSLPEGWQATSWSDGVTGTATVGGGVLTVDGAQAGAQTLYSPGRSLEFVATFSGDPFQHIGFSTDFSGPWVIFSTGSGGALYARSSDGAGGTVDTPIPGSWLGTPHDFRIDWAADGTATFWIDGAQVAANALPVTTPLRPLIGDFGAGGGRVVVDSLSLVPPGFVTQFDGTSLPPDWSTTAPAVATVGSGQLTVDGGFVGAQTLYSPGRSLEFVATFSGDPFQHVGFATDFSGPWAIFSTGSGGALYARSNDGAGTAIDTLIPGSWLGTGHDFRIDWTASGTTYWIDGVQVAAHAISIATPLRPVVSDFNAGGGTVSVDWLRMSPFSSAGTYISRVFDAGALVSWGSPSLAANTPAGTAATASVRTGNTPTPDATWTDFASAAGSGTFRYAQYRLDLTTTDPAQTPTVGSVTLATSNPGVTFTDTTVADFDAGTPGTGILADDGPASAGPFTAVLVTGPAHGSLVLSPDGSFTYTPTTDFTGTDSFVYKAQAQDGTLSAAKTITIDVSSPTGSTPKLTVTDASGAEGSAIALAISASPAVTDGSQTLSVTIGGLPAGATLNHGTLSAGVWTLSQADLSGLTVTPPDNGSFALTVTATAQVVATGSTTSVSTPLKLTVSNVAPTATFTGTGSITYGGVVTVQATNPFDPSAADTAAGFHYAFSLTAADVNTATYGSTGTTATASFPSLPAGSYTVYARIFDKDGGYTPYQMDVHVDQKLLTGLVTVAGKVYDGTTAATILARLLVGVVGTDDVSLAGGTAAFADKNVGTGKTVTVTGLSLAGANASNYTVGATATTTANITPKALSVTADQDPATAAVDSFTRLFGTPNPTFAYRLNGLVPGETAASAGVTGSVTFSTSASQFSPVGDYSVGTAGTLAAANYTFAYSSAGKLTVNRNGTVTNGYAATIGFWQNNNGRAMLLAEGKTAAGNTLANWLAATYPNLFGTNAGANNLTNKTNQDVVNLYLRLFSTPVNGMKLDAQIMAVALAVYATTDSLGGLTVVGGKNLAVKYGFSHDAGGLGSLTYDVTTNNAAFGNPANTLLTVNQILAQANANAVGTATGVTMYGNDAAKQQLAMNVFQGINEEGD